MTDPALDGPDAERAIAEALAACGLTPLDVLVDAAIHALNEQGVVLCDEHALAELRRLAAPAIRFREQMAAIKANERAAWKQIGGLW